MPVEGRDVQTGESAPANEQAQTGQPELTGGANSAEGQERKPKTGWTSEAERDEARRRGDERRAAQEREEMDRDNDDPGREMT